MPAAIDLYWLPLGAGGHSVKWNGRVYEAVAARLQRRPRLRPVPRRPGGPARRRGRTSSSRRRSRTRTAPSRGVVAVGPVGARWAGRLRVFRYEVRVWRGGRIPDIAEAVDSPRRLSDDEAVARRLLETVPQVPTPVWGRDELGAGEMWNSNAVIAWVIGSSGLDVGSIAPPPGGRAPGWVAGVEVARRAARPLA